MERDVVGRIVLSSIGWILMRLVIALLWLSCAWPALAQVGPGPLMSGIISPASKPLIGAPRSLGSNTHTGSGLTTTTITTTANINAGDAVVVFFAVSDNGAVKVISSISDGSANAYGQIVGTSNTANAAGEFWGAGNSGFIASGATITITHSSTSSVSANIAVGAVAIAGLLLASSVDKTNSASGTSNPPVSTGVLSQANEIVLGQSVRPAAYSGAAGFTTMFNITNGNVVLAAAYQIVASTASVTYTPSWTGGAIVTANMVASLKGFP